MRSSAVASSRCSDPPVRAWQASSAIGGVAACEALGVDDVTPPNPALAGARVALRQFRLSDAAAVSDACQDPDLARFTMMPDAMTEARARVWIERGLEWWPRGTARFAITVPPSDGCVGQIGIQLDRASRRAEAFYWLDRNARGKGYATRR